MSDRWFAGSLGLLYLGIVVPLWYRQRRLLNSPKPRRGVIPRVQPRRPTSRDRRDQ